MQAAKTQWRYVILAFRCSLPLCPSPAAGAFPPVWVSAQWKDLRLELISRRFKADLRSHEQKEEAIASVFSCPLAYPSSRCRVSMRATATPVSGWLITPNRFALSKGIWYTPHCKLLMKAGLLSRSTFRSLAGADVTVTPAVVAAGLRTFLPPDTLQKRQDSWRRF